MIRRPSLWLPIAMALVVVFLPTSVPVLDEESYLDIANQFELLRPYDWVRSWPPWGVSREIDAYVFAHPPLFLAWLAALQSFFAASGEAEWSVRVVEFVAAVPPAVLLGWSVGRLAERFTAMSSLAATLWLVSPIVALGAQRGLMPDLMVTALGTFAITAWREAVASAARGRVDWPWLAVGGLGLGLAMLTKYPAMLLIAVVLLDGWRRRDPWLAVRFAGVAVAVWALAEAGLAVVYGRPHLLEVLLRASEIPSGTLDGRALGVCVRLGLGLLPIALLHRSHAWVWPAGFVLAGGLLLLVWPDGAGLVTRLGVLGFGTIGGAMLIGVSAWLGPGLRRRGDPDSLLLAAWTLAVVLGVVFGHNFAAPRYLFPAIAPLALLLTRVAQGHRLARLVLLTSMLGQALLALSLTRAEHRFARGSAEAMRAALADPRVEAARAAHRLAMTGEWTARWAGRVGGAEWTDGVAVPSPVGPAVLEPGALILAPRQSSPGPVGEGSVRIATFESPRSGWLSVQCIERQISLYGETMGALPFGWCPGPVEVVEVWEVQ